MGTAQAIGTDPRNPEHLAIHEVERPTPTSSEALVRAHTISLNWATSTEYRKQNLDEIVEGAFFALFFFMLSFSGLTKMSCFETIRQ